MCVLHTPTLPLQSVCCHSPWYKSRFTHIKGIFFRSPPAPLSVRLHSYVVYLSHTGTYDKFNKDAWQKHMNNKQKVKMTLLTKRVKREQNRGSLPAEECNLSCSFLPYIYGPCGYACWLLLPSFAPVPQHRSNGRNTSDGAHLNSGSRWLQLRRDRGTPTL